jgi:hypothetical protein
LDIPGLVPAPGKHPAEAVRDVDHRVLENSGPGSLNRGFNQGPDKIRRRVIPLPNRGYKTIHHRPKTPDASLIGSFQTYFIPPGCDMAPQGTFDNLQVPVICPANSGKNLMAIQYDGYAIPQKHL